MSYHGMNGLGFDPRLFQRDAVEPPRTPAPPQSTNASLWLSFLAFRAALQRYQRDLTPLRTRAPVNDRGTARAILSAVTQSVGLANSLFNFETASGSGGRRPVGAGGIASSSLRKLADIGASGAIPTPSVLSMLGRAGGPSHERASAVLAYWTALAPWRVPAPATVKTAAFKPLLTSFSSLRTVATRKQVRPSMKRTVMRAQQEAAARSAEEAAARRQEEAQRIAHEAHEREAAARAAAQRQAAAEAAAQRIQDEIRREQEAEAAAAEEELVAPEEVATSFIDMYGPPAGPPPDYLIDGGPPATSQPVAAEEKKLPWLWIILAAAGLGGTAWLIMRK